MAMKAHWGRRALALAVWIWLAAVLPPELLAQSGRVLQAHDSRAEPGTTIYVPITLHAQGSENALGFSLRFDPQLLRFSDARLGAGIGDGQFHVNSVEATGGRIGIVLSLPAGQGIDQGNRVVAEIGLQMIGAATGLSTPLSFSDSPVRRQVVSISAELLNAEYAGAQVQLGEAPPPPQVEVPPPPPIVPPSSTTPSQTVEDPNIVVISGRVRTFETGVGVSGIVMAVSGTENRTMETRFDGTWEFRLRKSGNYRLAPQSFANTYTSLSTHDIALIRRHLAGTALLNSPYQLLAADVDSSGAVTDADIALLRRIVLGLTDLPDGTWKIIAGNHQFSDPEVPWNYGFIREYNALDRHMPEQDFIAIPLGDVNASWP